MDFDRRQGLDGGFQGFALGDLAEVGLGLLNFVLELIIFLFN